MAFAYFDGDGIGNTLERLLTENRVIEARKLSEDIKLAMSEIERYINTIPGITIIICGGDDLLIESSNFGVDNKVFEQIIHIFEKKTKHTMSCGVGNKASDSVRQLYLAKLYGKNRIFFEDNNE